MLKPGENIEEGLKKNVFINAVHEESPYGILVFSSKMEILDWNPAVEKLIGLAKDACIGRNLMEVFPTLINGHMESNSAFIKGTLVVAEAISGHFATGNLNGLKISVIVDKSGALNGGTLILTSPITVH
ncbi:hypothetical protein BH09BAC1_BH09BAC1_07000 [soil metagenome]